MRGARVTFHTLVEIQLKRHKIRSHSFVWTLQCILLPCDTICDSAVFRMTAHDICANSPHDPRLCMWITHWRSRYLCQQGVDNAHGRRQWSAVEHVSFRWTSQTGNSSLLWHWIAFFIFWFVDQSRQNQKIKKGLPTPEKARTSSRVSKFYGHDRWGNSHLVSRDSWRNRNFRFCHFRYYFNIWTSFCLQSWNFVFFSCEKGDKLAGRKAGPWQYCDTHRFLRNIIFTEEYGWMDALISQKTTSLSKNIVWILFIVSLLFQLLLSQTTDISRYFICPWSKKTSFSMCK